MSRSDRRSAGVCAGTTVLCLGILYWGGSPLLNLAAAGLLVFYLPGWAALLALHAGPEGWLESTVLRVTLSLAIVIIAGLALHLMGSITKPGWLGALGAVALAACVFSVALGRRAFVARPAEAGLGRARWAHYRLKDVLMMTMAIGLVGVAIALSVVLTLRNQEFWYTQLWIIPKKDAADKAVIGLHNAESSEESYAIELLVDRHLVQSWSEVSLKPGETWTTTFQWVGLGEYPRALQPLRELASREEAPKATISQRVGLGASARVEAVVYRSANRSVVYRHVWTAPQCATSDDAHGRPPCEF
jgi:uncharacterized membrane protein